MQEYPTYSPTDKAEQHDVLQEPEVTYMAQQRSNSAPGYVDAMNDWAFLVILREAKRREPRRAQ